MKKLLLILLCVPMIGFGQKNNFGTLLGDYEVIKNHPNAKGIDFIFRKPFGYNEMSHTSQNTVKLYSSGNSSTADREIIFQVFDYKTYFPEGKYINDSSIFEMIELLKKNNPSTEYYAIGKYPGYIFRERIEHYTSLQINIFLEDVFFVISFTSVYIIGPSDIKYLKKISNAVIFD
tara:strand:+ start:33 stop:560 length:528 start_codon:yes stop_codon:yes gene_type:complete